MSNIKYPTKEAIEKLSKDLNIEGIECQDWEYTSADESRIEEFINYYFKNNLGDIEKFTLMILIISSCDDAIGNGILEEKSWEKVKSILIDERSIHMNTIEYWACLDSDIEDAFNITPLIRLVIDNL